MVWIEVSIDTNHHGIDAICTQLATLGIDSLMIRDQEEFFEILNRGDGAKVLADSDFISSINGVHKVVVYLADEPEGLLSSVKKSIAQLRDGDSEGLFGSLTLTTRAVKEEDWAESWKKFFKPLKIGGRLLVQPEWEPIEQQDGRIVFLNNPGMAFGTGEHETTRLCLEQLDRLVTGGERVLDVGCGSGILAICALLLGASQADAVDIDPLAVAATRRNAQTNGLDTDRCKVHLGNLLEPVHANRWLGPYQLITANILADVVAALCPLLSRRLSHGGRLIASGIIEPSREDVRCALSAEGLEIEDEKTIASWCCLTARKC